MKRNFLSAALLTVVSAATLSFAITAAPAEGWHKSGKEKEVSTTVRTKTMSERAKYRQSRGISSPGAQLLPIGNCIMTGAGQVRNAKAKVVHRSIEAPRGNIYAVVNRHNEMTYPSQAFMGKLDLKSGLLTREHTSSVYCPYLGDDYELQSNVIAHGKIYCPGSSEAIDGATYGWDVVDLESGDILGRYDFGGDIFGAPYFVTYDEKNNVFYGVCIGQQTSSNLCVFYADKMTLNGVNEEGVAYDYLGYLGANNTFIAALAYDSKQEVLYAFDQLNNVYTVEIDNGRAVLLEAGYLDSEAVFFMDGYTGQMVYSPMDEMFVTLMRDNETQSTRLYFIDPNSWEVFNGPTVQSDLSVYINALMCNDDFAEADAPELPAAATISFDKANTTGKITFSAPEYTYYGVAIGSSKMKMRVAYDETVLFEGEMSAGESKTLDCTIPEGPHSLTVTASLGDLRSPVRTQKFHTGYDNPLPPADLKLDIDKLTWTAPGSVGAHDGYVDTNMLEYNVYVDGVMQNVNPVETTEFTLRMPENMERAKIEVEAVAHNKTSERANLSGVIGKALNLPRTFAPTTEEGELFTVIDANRDGRSWWATVTDATVIEERQNWAFIVGYFDDANDWLITPALHFDDPDVLYNVNFDLTSVYDAGSEESYSIYIGKKPTIDGMLDGTCIYEVKDQYYNFGFEKQSYNFGVKEAGDYYIGIHITSSRAVDAWGMNVADLTIAAVTGATSQVPNEPLKIDLAPGAEAEQYATAKVTLPTTDVAGKPLPADKDVTVTMSYSTFSGKASGKPGETVEVSCDVDNDGFINFSFTTSNEYGTGYTRTRRCYVGLDRPLAPQNIQGEVAEDNLSMKLTWDAPGTVGVNGGYVDPLSLTYQIYTLEGVLFDAVGTPITATTATFVPSNPALVSYYVGPAARNEIGESVGSRFVQDMLGTPYPAPVKEYWNSSSFVMNPYNFNTEDNEMGNFSASTWESIGDANALGKTYAGATPQQGAIVAYSTIGAPAACKLVLPKVDTRGMSRANFTLRYWDNNDTPEIKIYGRRYGHPDLELIGTITPANPTRPQWREGVVALPAEYLENNWIQLHVFANLTGAMTEYLVLDTWQIFPDFEYDLSVNTLSGPVEASIGDQITYNVKVTNSGSERNGGKLNIVLVDADGKVYATDQANIPDMPSTQVFERNAVFDLDGSFADADKLTVRATVTSDNDEGSGNNTKELTLSVKSPQIPVVTDLASKGINEDGSVSLTWSAPTASYGDFDNFESVPAFQNTGKIGMWTVVDQDGLTPVGLQNGSLNIAWDGSDKPCSWTVVDAEQLNLQGDDRAFTHSGKKYLMARSAFIPEDAEDYEAYQSSDWLISPEVIGGTTVGFWINTLSTEKEFWSFWYSTSGTELGQINKLDKTKCGDFRKATSTELYKTGNDTWEYVEFTLPARAKYFAIRYCSMDGYAMMIDDISFTPANKLTRSADSYSVFRSDNGGKFNEIANGLTAPGYVDTAFPDSKAHYYVVAYADIDGVKMAGPKSNDVYIEGSKVSQIDGNASITGRAGEIVLIGFEGVAVEIYTTDGKTAVKDTVRANQAHYALDKGIYLVKAGDRTAKVVVD